MEHIEKCYNIRVSDISLLDRGTALVYKIKTEDAVYALKIYPEQVEKSWLEKEQKVLQILTEKDFPVPVYLQAKNGQTITQLQISLVTLTHFLEGNIMVQGKCSSEQLKETGMMLGKIIRALDDERLDLPKFDASLLCEENKIRKSIHKYEMMMQKLTNGAVDKQIQVDLKQKINRLQTCSSWISKEDIEKLTYHNSHGDYSVMQLLWNEQEITGVLDFVTASKLPVVWEVIRSYHYGSTAYHTGEFHLPEFLDYILNFEQHVPLTRYDKEFMIKLYVLQLLHSGYGYEQYLENREEKNLLEFGFLRTKICNYLYENSEQLTKEIRNGK